MGIQGAYIYNVQGQMILYHPCMYIYIQGAYNVIYTIQGVGYCINPWAQGVEHIGGGHGKDAMGGQAPTPPGRAASPRSSKQPARLALALDVPCGLGSQYPPAVPNVLSAGWPPSCHPRERTYVGTTRGYDLSDLCYM